MPEGLVKLEGMVELRRELRALDSRLPRAIQKANKRAAQLVADRGKALLASTGGVGPKAALSVKALAGQAYASVRLGGAAFPFAAGQNFGSDRYTQFPPRPGSGQDYGLYKAIGETRSDVIAGYDQFIEEGFKEAFPEGA